MLFWTVLERSCNHMYYYSCCPSWQHLKHILLLCLMFLLIGVNVINHYEFMQRLWSDNYIRRIPRPKYSRYVWFTLISFLFSLCWFRFVIHRQLFVLHLICNMLNYIPPEGAYLSKAENTWKPCLTKLTSIQVQRK